MLEMLCSSNKNIQDTCLRLDKRIGNLETAASSSTPFMVPSQDMTALQNLKTSSQDTARLSLTPLMVASSQHTYTAKQNVHKKRKIETSSSVLAELKSSVDFLEAVMKLEGKNLETLIRSQIIKMVQSNKNMYDGIKTSLKDIRSNIENIHIDIEDVQYNVDEANSLLNEVKLSVDGCRSEVKSRLCQLEDRVANVENVLDVVRSGDVDLAQRVVSLTKVSLEFNLVVIMVYFRIT